MEGSDPVSSTPSKVVGKVIADAGVEGVEPGALHSFTSDSRLTYIPTLCNEETRATLYGTNQL